MRLIHRQRQHHSRKAPRIAITQDEITADLHYPGTRRVAARETATVHRSAPR